MLRKPECDTPCHEIKAKDTVKGILTKRSIHYQIKRVNLGVRDYILLAVRARVMLTNYIDVGDGLVN